MKVLRSIAQTINSVRTINDIKKVSEWGPDLRDQFTSLNAPNYLKGNLTPVQSAALVLTIPEHHAPQEIYNACKHTLSIISELDPQVQSGIMMRFARSALLSGNVEECITILEVLSHANPNIYTAPYLYLTAISEHPVPVIPAANPQRRLFSFELYYAGMNHLLLEDYSTASELFLHCLHLSCPTDMIRTTIDSLSCAMYLNHVPYEQFIAVIPPKLKLDPDTMAIWRGMKPLSKMQNDFSYVYIKLWDKICHERVKRNIILLSKTTTNLLFSKFKEYCGCYDEDVVKGIVNEVNEEKLANIVIDDRKVILEAVNREEDIDKMMENVEKLFSKVKEESEKCIPKTEEEKDN